MSEKKYWAFLSVQPDDGAVLSDVPDPGPEAFEYTDGQPLLEKFPSHDEAVMCMSVNNPDDSILHDVVACEESVKVISSKVKTIFERHGATNVEYLPVTIWDHKNKPCSTDYFILNPLESFDIIDMDKADVVMNAFFPTRVKRIKNLIVNHEAMPEDAKVFRASRKMAEIFVNDEIANALKDADISGCKLMKAEGWDGFDF